jgi:ArsR family transcriptional regulator
MTICKNDTHNFAQISIKNNNISDDIIKEVCSIYKAIGEASRLKIILALLEGDMCVYHISEYTGLKQSLTSHQLGILKQNNVIKSRKDGQLVIYSIADEHIRAIVNMSLEHVKCL